MSEYLYTYKFPIVNKDGTKTVAIVEASNLNDATHMAQEQHPDSEVHAGYILRQREVK